jgi:uncharacterized protein (TIGR03790 family)
MTRIWKFLSVIVCVMCSCTTLLAGFEGNPVDLNPLPCADSSCSASDRVWVDDALPAGAVPVQAEDGWQWTAGAPSPVSGVLAHPSMQSGADHQHYFQDASERLDIRTADILFAYVYLDPQSPPSQVMLQWRTEDGNWHRAHWGPELIWWAVGGSYQAGALPTTGKWIRLEVPASAVGLEGRSVNGMAFTLFGGRATWDRAGAVSADASIPPSTLPSTDHIWVDDALPIGAVPIPAEDGWQWTVSGPTPASGVLAHASIQSGADHQHYFQDASERLDIRVGDVLFAYVYLDPQAPPSQVMLQWRTDGEWHRAHWGADLIPWARGASYPAGLLPPTGTWIRLEVPASAVGLEGRSLNGMAFTLFGGRASWDRAGVAASAGTPPDTITPNTDHVWVDDKLPAGAVQAVAEDGWNWRADGGAPGPAPVSGALLHTSALINADHQHYFESASEQLDVRAGDRLYAYVYLNPSSPPSQVMLQWKTGGEWKRAHWGADLIPWARGGSYPAGPLPAAGTWFRLEVPASAVGLEGRSLNGMAFTLFGGQAFWDRAGVVSTGSGGDTTPPSAPTQVSATAISSSAVAIRWAASIDSGGSGLRAYRIYRGSQWLVDVDATTDSYTDSGLAAASTYSYFVAALDGAGNESARMGPAIATTPADFETLSSRVLVVYNSALPESLDVANYYMQKRGIPAANKCAIFKTNSLEWFLSREEYVAVARDPIRACLDAIGRDRILYIVFTYGTPFKTLEGSTDQLIADIWEQQPVFPQGLSLNPYYALSSSAANVYIPGVSFADFRRFSPLIYSVWRLDAPTSALAKGLVDQAIQVEASGGLNGRGCFDSRSGDLSILADIDYGAGDWDIARASQMFGKAGFPVVHDTNLEEFGTPPAPQRCDGAGFYTGWYSYGRYNDVFSWTTGAIGWHLDSASALSPRSGDNWAGGALGRGIAVTTGAVGEPYLEGLPHADGALRNLLEGLNVGDAIFRNTAWIHWMIINVGDPLYRPFPGGRALP